MSIIMHDIDQLIIKFVDLPGLTNLIAVNKYFFASVSVLPIINQWRAIATAYNYLDEFVYVEICGAGYLSYAKYVYQKLKINNNYQMLSFSVCCMTGRIETAKWLLSTYYYAGMKFDGNEFVIACERGHTKIAQWLVSFADFTGDYVNAYKYSCENGHTETAQWLLLLCESIGYKIDMCDNDTDCVDVYDNCVNDTGRTNIIDNAYIDI